MKQQTIIAITCIGILLSCTTKNNLMETETIKRAITENYIHGAFNETNIEAFKSIFHPEFAIINIQQDDSFFLFNREMWATVLQERKDDKDFDYASIALTPTFRKIDIVENKASVTLDLMLNDKMVYTDFLLLAKIGGEWKIVSKIYHEY